MKKQIQRLTTTVSGKSTNTVKGVYDCPQKDNEDNCGSCDFEQGTCFWYNGLANSGQQWKLKAANDKTVAPAGPAVDGRGKASGHYMIVEPNSAVKRRAELYSADGATNGLKRTYFTCIMTFKYYLTGNASFNDLAYFGVSVLGMAYTPLWRSLVKTTSAWTTAQVHIGEHVRPI